MQQIKVILYLHITFINLVPTNLFLIMSELVQLIHNTKPKKNSNMQEKLSLLSQGYMQKPLFYIEYSMC